VVASIPTVATLDGLSYDPATRRIYTTGGEGFVDVTQQIDADHYERIARILTGPNARTSSSCPSGGAYTWPCHAIRIEAPSCACSRWCLGKLP